MAAVKSTKKPATSASGVPAKKRAAVVWRKPKPIATVGGAVKAEMYRSTFKPFDVLKYIDQKALQRAERATFEIGTLEGGGVSVTLAIDVERGIVTGMRPCASALLPKAPKGGPSAAAMKKVRLEALKQRGGNVPPPLNLPKPVTYFFKDPWEIDIGPITIILGGGMSNICITVSGGSDGLECSYCLFGPTVCSQMGPPF